MPDFAATTGGGVATTDGDNDGSMFSQSQANNYYGDIKSADELMGQTGNIVTVDDATDWVDRKGGEVITLVQHSLKPICFVCFLISLGVVVVGAIGNKKVMVGGIIAMFIIGVVFTIVTCAPQVINAFSSWLMS